MQSKSTHIEVIPERLFWLSDTSPPSRKGCNYFCVDTVILN